MTVDEISKDAGSEYTKGQARLLLHTLIDLHKEQDVKLTKKGGDAKKFQTFFRGLTHKLRETMGLI